MPDLKIDAHIHINGNDAELFGKKSEYEALLELYLSRIRGCSFVDDMYIWTGILDISEKISTPERVTIIPCSGDDTFTPFNSNPLDMMNKITSCPVPDMAKGDVILFAEPQYLLIRQMSYEAMYDQLMENEQAHTIYPVYKVDPHLYLKIPGEESLLPVWEYPGLDRQKYPQLYRKCGVYLFHTKRVRYKQPLKEMPYIVPWHEGRRYTNDDDLEFADYMFHEKGFV
ncbi:MAG: hypothetical protein WC799_23760 [Desulfobacteraceae bacterium]